MIKESNNPYQKYQAEIQKLQEDYLDRLKNLNIESEKDGKIGYQLVQQLKTELDKFCSSNFTKNDGSKKKTKRINFKKASFELKEEKDDFYLQSIAEPRELIHIESVTKDEELLDCRHHIAVKNENSFLLASESSGFKVAENGLVIYSNKANPPSEKIVDVCYHKKLNCYLSASRTTIYRKDIDSKDPYPCIQITCLNRCYRFFRYCGFHGRVILINSNKGFSVLNARARRVEFEAPSYLEGGKTRIKDFELFGKRQDRAVALGWKQSLLLLCNFDFRRKKVLQVSSTPIQTERNKVFGMSLAVDPKGKYVCVETGRAAQINQNRSSKIFIFKIQTIKLEFLSLVENWRPRMDYREALICYGYFGWKVIFVGLSFCDLGKAHLIVYDEMEKKLEEKREESVEHQTLSPRRILRCGDFLYYVGGTGKVMRLKLSLRG